jgi:DNA-binding HxlR family transcriptional regulator
MDISQISSRLPQSAELILDALKRNKILRFEEMMSLTGLSKRSLLYAIKILRECNMVEVKVCMTDTRKRFYCLKSVGAHNLN